jgi:hypothetical protein
MGVCEERTCARVVEESPVLEAVVRERLMTQQATKGLAGVVMICELWILAELLVLTSHECISGQ